MLIVVFLFERVISLRPFAKRGSQDLVPTSFECSLAQDRYSSLLAGCNELFLYLILATLEIVYGFYLQPTFHTPVSSGGAIFYHGGEWMEVEITSVRPRASRAEHETD